MKNILDSIDDILLDKSTLQSYHSAILKYSILPIFFFDGFFSD